MKKVFLAILATIAVMAMVSCNKDDQNKGGKKGGKTATEVNIKIDGDVSEWKDVAVAAELDEDTVDAGRDSLLTLKLAADSQNLYVYFEFIVPDNAYVPVDVFINSDGDAATGFSAWLWSEIGWEYLIESEDGCLENKTTVRNMDDATIYKAKTWKNAAGEQIGGWDTKDGAEQEALETKGFCTSAGKVANGIGFVEMAIERSAINARAKGKISVGIEVHCGGWQDNGILPQISTGSELAAAVEFMLP